MNDLFHELDKPEGEPEAAQEPEQTEESVKLDVPVYRYTRRRSDDEEEDDDEDRDDRHRRYERERERDKEPSAGDSRAPPPAGRFDRRGDDHRGSGREQRVRERDQGEERTSLPSFSSSYERKREHPFSENRDLSSLPSKRRREDHGPSAPANFMVLPLPGEMPRIRPTTERLNYNPASQVRFSLDLFFLLLSFL